MLFEHIAINPQTTELHVSIKELMNIPHIKIIENSESVVEVSVEDVELFDFIEDYLIEECNLEYEYLKVTDNEGLIIHTMSFPKTIKKETIDVAINKLDQKEIEKIFNINNKL